MSPTKPIARLTQTFGPVTAEWALYDEHLEIETRTPFGVSFAPIPLARLDGFSFESGPPPGLVTLAAASLVAATVIALAALAGATGLSAVFLASTLAAFLVLSCRFSRHERVVVHTLGARRFVLHAGLSAPGELDRFLQHLERVRLGEPGMPGLAALEDDEAGEDAGPDLGDSAEPETPGPERAPIDRRWIN